MNKKIGPKGGVLYPFQKGVSGNPEGRPKKIVTKLKEEGYRQSEIYDTFLKIGAMHQDEFHNLIENPDITIIERGICTMFLNYIKNGKTELLDYILPKQKSIALSNEPGPSFELRIIQCSNNK